MDNMRTPRRHTVAAKIVSLAVDSLFVDMPYLDTALFRLDMQADAEGRVRTWATDGRYALYDADAVIERFRGNEQAVSHDLLHVVLHCVFRHMFVEPGIEQRFWNLACDIAVEMLIDSLGVASADDGRSPERSAYLAALVDLPDGKTAERVYRALIDADLSDEDLLVLEDAFFVDDHPWYWAGEDGGRGDQAVDGQPSSDSSPDPLVRDGAQPDAKSPSGDELRREWQEASRSVQAGLEAYTSQRAEGGGSPELACALKALNRKRYDYRQFLRSLCSWGEQVQVNPDEYDNIFYTFGLEHYGDMPLVEPLEYREVKKLKDVAIAIDTSGSVDAGTLQVLVERTYDLVSAESNAHRRFRIHLIQCDDEIRSDIVLHSREDLERVLPSMQLAGRGGTDFRPVFDYVDSLVESGAFSNFKGLIYFTDGQGVYPARRPAYRAAFVFLEDAYDDGSTPPWAIKIVLSDQEVRRL